MDVFMSSTKSGLFKEFDLEYIIETSLKLRRLSNSSIILENALANNDISVLLMEELESKDIEKLRKTTKETKKAVEQIQAAVGDKLPSLKDPLDSLHDAITDSLKFVSELDLENPKGVMANIGRFFGSKVDIASSFQAVLQIQTKTKQIADSLEQAIPLILKNIEDFVDETQQDIPLSELAGTGDVPDANKIKGGIQKAFKAGGGGFLGKLTGFLRKAAGKSKLLAGVIDPDFDEVADNFMSLSITQMKELEAALGTAADVEMVDKATTEDLAKAEPEDYQAVAADQGGGAAPENPDKAEPRPDFTLEDLMALLQKMNPPAAKELEAMPEEEQEAVAADDVEEIVAGEVSPEDAAEEVSEEAEEAADAPKWSDIANSFLDDLKSKGLSDEGEEFIKKYMTDIINQPDFEEAVGASLKLKESLFIGNISSFLFEEIEYKELEKASKDSAEFSSDEEAAAVTSHLATMMSDAGVEVAGDPGVELTDDIIAGIGKAEEEIPKPEVDDIYHYTTKKGKETFAKVLEVLDDENVQVTYADGKGGWKKSKFAVSNTKLGEKTTAEEAGISEEEGGEDMPEDPEVESSPEEEIKAAPRDVPPGEAIGQALDDWEKSLSKSSQETINRKNRLQALKDVINASLEGAAQRAAKHVKTAIKKWRSEHEETLITSKRFAKKNFDTLSELIPQLVAAIMAKKAESAGNLITVGSIHRSVYRHLNKKFYGTRYLLSEMLIYDDDNIRDIRDNRPTGNFDLTNSDSDDSTMVRWRELAGL